MSNKFGIYIHIPFCKTICPFCNFNVYKAESQDQEGLVALLLSELEAKHGLFEKKKLVSVHFGGGTPSLLSLELINKILKKISEFFPIDSKCEIAIEVNPYDDEVADLKNLSDVGISRLSVGIQSFNDDKLKLLGRKSTKKSNLEFIDKISNCGINNFNLDFIFGVDKETPSDWESEFSYLQELNIKHISTYCLTIENSTPFWKMHQRGEIIKVPDDIFLDMVNITKSKLHQLGLEQYEVSNFSKPSFESSHNLLYWNSDSYLGLGPGAHSSLIDFENNKYYRWENKKTIHDYSKFQTIDRFKGVDLGLKQYIKDAFMMGLRLKKGVKVPKLQLIRAFQLNSNAVSLLINQKVITYENDMVKLTDEGFNVSDTVIFKIIDGIEFISD